MNLNPLKMLSDYMKQRQAKAMGLSAPAVKKEAKPIPKVSAKRKEENKVYKKQVKEAIKKDNRCKVKSPACTGKAQGLHHLQKRSPGNLTKEENQLPACNACNLYIEENSEWAKNNGFTVSRFKPVIITREEINGVQVLIAESK